MATPTSTVKGGSSRDGTAKTMVADQITQSIQSTSNLLHLMLQSSPSQAPLLSFLPYFFSRSIHLKINFPVAELMKLPKSLFAKTSTIKNTELVLEQLPRVISSLDAHMDNGLQSVPQLKTVMQLLSNIENCQLKTLSRAQDIQQETGSVEQPPKPANLP
ncbi:hypothetical protein MTR67_027973 [Solanum verrucosum]|uniref:Tobamovirus multiplication protein 2B n=1 Tax=Solanum verrucosum TaxID=315347 RepID=A0AAF0R4P3_SOLVR|nr:hypothetical protein MTR67_027973 [Solanum verrucosum]